MSNKPKLSAEYFPHYAAQKKTIPILKAKFGSNGYAFWYQLLEMLCAAKGHFLNLSAPGDIDFLAVKTGIPVTEIELILRELLFRGKLDRELWENDKILWCQNLVDNLSVLYSKRISAPEKPIPSRKSQIHPGNDISAPEKPGSKVKESKGKERKENILSPSGDFAHFWKSKFDEFWQTYPSRNGHKTGKSIAAQKWDAMKGDEILYQKIISALNKQIEHKNDCDRQKKFCPEFQDAHRWLKNRSWENEIKTAAEIYSDERRIQEDEFARINGTQRN